MIPRRTATGFAVLFLAASARDAAAQSWTQLTPAPGSTPAARRNASAIHDPVDHRMVIFGGFGATYLNDMWAFDLDSHAWADLTPGSGPAPAPRLTPASVYDPVEHRMITWSGQGPGVFFNDVWAFDFDTNAWSQFTPTGGPPNIRYGVGYTFDPAAGELVTFAGFTNLGRFDDVWRFDGQASTWTDVSPESNPLARCLHAACYDAHNHRMIMYAGQNNSGPLDDIWALDLDTDTWTDLTPATRPTGRFFSPVVYDATNHRATVFGGQTLAGPTNEVWVFDLWTNLWTQLSPSGTPPSARSGSAAIYDGGQDRMVVFGGNDGAVKNDVWTVEGLSNTSTAVDDAPRGLPVLFPNFPNPFNPSTTIRYELPARGHVRMRVFDAGGRLVRTLADGVEPAGARRVVWDGRNDDGRSVASGVYFCRLDAGGTFLSRKLVLLK